MWRLHRDAIRRDLVCAKKLSVQFDELPEETSIGVNATVIFHCTNSLHQRQVLLQHQVGQHQCGRTAHSHVTVHQNFAWRSDPLI